MKKLCLFILLALFSFVFSGCGPGSTGASSSGGQGGLYSAGTGGGSMNIKINWPEGSKGSVLASAYSVKINVCTQVNGAGSDSSGQDATAITRYMREVNAIIIRNDGAATSQAATINGIPIGSRVVVAQAYNASGTEIGYGTQSTMIVTGNNPGVTVSLVSGTFPYTITGMSDAQVPTASNSSPNIFSVYPTGGAAGTPVTLSGSGFGTYSSTSVLRFGNANVTPTTWSDNRIIFTVPEDAATGATQIKATASSGQSSNIVYFTVTGAGTGPQILTISPLTGQIGATVIINGTGFGSGGGANVPTVSFNGVRAFVATTWSDTRLQCQVPTGATSGPVTVTAGGTVSNAVDFTITGSTAWTPINIPNYSNLTLKSVWCSGAGSINRVYTVGNDSGNGGKIFYYDGTWHPMTAPNYRYNGIFGIDNDTIYATASTGSKAVTWQPANGWMDLNGVPSNFTPNYLWVRQANNIYFVGSEGGGGTIYHYSGINWIRTYLSPAPPPLNGIGMTVNNGNVFGFAVGNGGWVYNYDSVNGGWNMAGAKITPKDLFAVWGEPMGDVFYAVGASGTIYTYDIFGRVWTQMVSGTANTLTAVWGTTTNDIYAVGLNNTILHYDGTSWVSMQSGTTNVDFYGVFGALGNVYVVGTGGTVLKK